MKVLVIGYGNPLRGDDGVGWHAGLDLADHIRQEGVEFMVTHQLTPELAETITEADLLILIDACEGEPPGQISIQRISPDLSQSRAFSHHLDPFTLVTCAQELYGRCPETFVFTVACNSFEYVEALTPPVQAAIQALRGYVRDLIAGSAGEILENA